LTKLYGTDRINEAALQSSSMYNGKWR